MFYQGDLQSGITAAIQRRKLVTCFIFEDSNEDVDLWEHSWLPEHKDLIAEKTILLRMRLHSQEAEFLAAFCPMTIAPSLAVIDNGKVVVKLEAPIDAQQWQTRFVAALESREPTSAPATSTSAADTPSESSTTPAAPASAASFTHADLDPAAALARMLQGPPGSTPPPPAAFLQSLLPDRAARLEADHAAKQAAEKAARIARAEAQRKNLESTQPSGKGKEPVGSTDAPPAKARTDWVREQAKRKEEAKEERERILQQIKSDREERKLREAIAKEVTAPAQPLQKQARAPANFANAICALQIRLMDGSSMKRQFTAVQTLQDVRKWIKDDATAETAVEPYAFRQLLAPQPSRAIQAEEESQSLHSLGMAPSATLILVPRVTEQPAKSMNGSIAFIGTIFSLLFGMIAAILTRFGIVRAGVQSSDSIAGGNGQDSSKLGQASGIDLRQSTTKLRPKTLADSRAEQQEKDPPEFYNGNSSAFEGRRDD